MGMSGVISLIKAHCDGVCQVLTIKAQCDGVCQI